MSLAFINIGYTRQAYGNTVSTSIDMSAFLTCKLTCKLLSNCVTTKISCNTRYDFEKEHVANMKCDTEITFPQSQGFVQSNESIWYVAIFVCLVLLQEVVVKLCYILLSFTKFKKQYTRYEEQNNARSPKKVDRRWCRRPLLYSSRSTSLILLNNDWVIWEDMKQLRLGFFLSIL